MLPELHTKRLILREIQLEDAPALQAYQTSPEYWSCGQALEPEEFADGYWRIKQYFKHRKSDRGQHIYVYVAFDRSQSLLIGEAGLSLHTIDKASLGFSVAPEYWRQGYATEIANRLITFGFDELGLNCISANVVIENKASRRVLEKTGMIYKEFAKEKIWAQEKWWTEANYEIHKEDYKKR